MDTICPQCHAPMTCNADKLAATGKGCWCADLPPLLPIPTNATAACLCPTCLTAKLQQQKLSRTPIDSHVQ